MWAGVNGAATHVHLSYLSTPTLQKETTVVHPVHGDTAAEAKEILEQKVVSAVVVARSDPTAGRLSGNPKTIVWVP